MDFQSNQNQNFNPQQGTPGGASFPPPSGPAPTPTSSSQPIPGQAIDFVNPSAATTPTSTNSSSRVADQTWQQAQSQPAQSQPAAQQYDSMGVPIVDYASINQSTQQVNDQAMNYNNTPINAPGPSQGKPKPKLKGPMIALIGVIVLFGIITAVLVIAMPKSSTTEQTGSKTSQQQASKQQDEDKVDDPEQPYKFINDQQRSNLQNLQTAITTFQAQNTKHDLPPATPQGWAQLKASTVIDPVTYKPYAFTSSGSSNIGEVQYVLKGVCSSDSTIIPSTDVASFALRMKLYNGTYACVDSSNAK